MTGRLRWTAAALGLAFASLTVPLAAQRAAPAKPPAKNPYLKLSEPWPEAAVLQARRTQAEQRPLFSSSDPLPFTLAADFKTINKDRNPESTNRYPAVLSVTDERGREHTLHVRVSPRGHFRRMARNC